MDREKIQTFIQTAETELASVRSSLLLIAQHGNAAELASQRRNLACLQAAAAELGLSVIERLTAECDGALDLLSRSDMLTPGEVFPALDLVTNIEAALFEIPTQSDDFPTDIAGFVDASFDEMLPPEPEDDWGEEFEIDEETLDIFRSEAEDLLSNITNGVQKLSASPGDQNALWDVRRNAHTFKGAAGIVGLKNESVIAHRMEDLLDKMVEMRREAVPQVVDFLDASARRLKSIIAAKDLNEDQADLETSYRNVMAWLSSPVEQHTDESKQSGNATQTGVTVIGRVAGEKITTTPIVRVSLDRLDELIKISRSVLINRSAIAERFEQIGREVGLDTAPLEKLASLFETQKHLTDEIQAKLLRIRMVKFGTLETRLSRAVNVTCLDENKKASVELENGEVEIDTQIIDALIEPLLHLLKNAVVHGIEPPDTRRMIGKPERGTIRIRLEADSEALVLSVTDDGGGISASKLKEKAVASGIIDAETAAAMDDRDAIKLIFDRGLTTAEKLDLNAGRGVGMSIVKESVENRGGTVLVESEPQRGTTFTILMPLNKSEPPASAGGQFAGSKAPSGLEDELSNWPPTYAGGSDKTPLVLIVDDSASIRHQTTKLVEEAGLRVITAQNGAEALELLLSSVWEPDLILSDVEMPQIDGWEFLEYVKTDDNLGHIPMVMITSLDTDEHRARAFALGASDYIVKPFSSKDLEQILEKFCGGVVA